MPNKVGCLIAVVWLAGCAVRSLIRAAEAAIKRAGRRDLLLVGSLLSATATLTALVLLSRGEAPGTALAVHLLPLPYGLFMVTSLWRTPQSPALARWASLLWLALTLLI